MKILRYAGGPGGVKWSSYLLAIDTILSLPKPLRCRPLHMSCLDCPTAVALRAEKLSLFKLCLAGKKACCSFSLLAIVSSYSERGMFSSSFLFSTSSIAPFLSLNFGLRSCHLITHSKANDTHLPPSVSKCLINSLPFTSGSS